MQIFLSELSRGWINIQININSIGFVIILQDIYIWWYASGYASCSSTPEPQDFLARLHGWPPWMLANQPSPRLTGPSFYVGKPFQGQSPTEHRPAPHHI